MVESTRSRGLPGGHERAGLDTNIFVYFLEDHPRYGGWCGSLFERIEHRRTWGVTSTVSLLEVLVEPYRTQNDELLQKVFALLTTYPHLTWVPVTLEVADRAADLRARYRLSTPDAIQVATAIISQATKFIGNDKALRRVKEIECVILDDHV